MARASLIDAQSRPSGAATIRQGSDGISLIVEPTGLPAGTYAMHLHQTGKCDAPGFTTAGTHWNPAGRQHGLANSNGPHAGDFPNIIVTATGTTTVSVPLDFEPASGAQPLLDGDGAAIVIHARPDDNMTDPSGNSGARIICGVFQVTNP
ncbi:MAG: superoxide dismutase family protein [Sphingorhabdus sp.]